ncbi:MAG: AAA family ATPase [Myxococcota bacterium]|nr:AAA family ATPase [Myxococcota bacterium]
MQPTNDYSIRETIYESINTLIYRAWEEKENRSVVLKILNKPYPTPEEVSKFKQEYHTLTSLLADEGVVQVYALTQIKDAPAISMADIGGQSLADFLASTKLDAKDFLHLAMQIVEIIENIHKRNIIHKDINPANIILTIPQQMVRIIDFGISTTLPRESTSIKNPNVLEGTLAYISPEQTGRMNRSLDYRTDFYSLGVTFYQMITGQLPFDARDPLQLIHSHIAVQPNAPNDLDETIPKLLSDIILKLMDKNPEGRYQSAHGLKADLAHCRKELEQGNTLTLFSLGCQDLSDKFQIPQKLYGRQHEIDTLMNAFERVCEDNAELMLVSGFPGIGKSMLVNEIITPIVAHNGYFVSGKFESLEKNVPYSAFIQAFNELAKQILAGDAAQIALWKEKIRSVLGPNGKIITNIIPLFERIIGPQPELPALGPVESQNRFNFVFQEFIKALAGSEHPLVLFLDDLQWADLASLHLIKLFITDTDIKHLFVIGAYRDNETPESHPLMLTLGEIQKTKAIVNSVFLQPLLADHVNHLLADTLHCSPAKTEPLAALLVRKTQGNPFFINEFLKSLYSQKLIAFSFEHGWTWRMQDIENIKATDNVVDLMTEKITGLSEPSQEILKLGACIGSTFTLATLKIICKKPVDDILLALEEVLCEGILHKIDEIYQFSHDRVLEAAYSLIPDAEKSQQHYCIGKLELNATDEGTLQEKIFYIVNQLNAGTALVKEKSEKGRLAELNNMAGKKALASSAYVSALNYFQTGIQLLEKNSWEENYGLTHALYQEAVVAAQLSAEYDVMEQLAETVFQHAASILDSIKVYETKIFACFAQNQLLEGIRIGLLVLRQLGINLPDKPGNTRIVYELIRLKISLLGKSIDQLINLPELKDPYKLAAMQIMAGICSSAMYATPNLIPLLIFYGVRISVKYGNSVYTPFFYSGYGMIHCGIFFDIENGYKWGKLAVDLVEKLQIKETKARVLLVFWFMINPWKNSIHESLDPLLETYKIGLETGDLEFSAHSANTYCISLYFAGVDLPYTAEEMTKWAEMIKKINQETPYNYELLDRQFVLNLLGESENPCALIGPSYDINKMMPIHEKANDINAIFNVYFYLLNLNYLFGHYDEALKYADLSRSTMDTTMASPYQALVYFYDALTRLALFPTQQKSVQKKFAKIIAKSQKKMKNWALHSPKSYKHKFHLVEAEIARVNGKEYLARQHYATSIKLAHENRYLHEEALSLERAGEFWLDLKEERVATVYLTEAYHRCRMWGSIAKAEQIKEKYGYLLLPTSAESQKSTITAYSHTASYSDAIDLSTVMKASQALSSEINLGRLLKGIMDFSLQSAGAQRGFLLIENERDQKLYIEAEGEPEKEILLLQSISVENNPSLSSQIINYVHRTDENVILHNAHQKGNFTRDPYIKKNKIKSLLCSPIIHKGKTSGILYLENNLVTDAFTDERIELLRVLSAQAAISIENARLVTHRENAAKLSKEMEIAANIQTCLLPKQPSINGYQIAAHMAPADEVGGDYYDILNVGQQDWVVIADASGHGVPAGLVMMMVQTCIHHTLNINPAIQPSELLTIVNKTIAANIKLMNLGKYMTITVLTVQENGKISFAGLHQDIIVYRKKTDTIEMVETDGLWLGILDDVQNMMSDNSFELDRGDAMLLYTDGITEAWKKGAPQNTKGGAEQMFGEEKLKQLFAQSSTKPPHDIKNHILKELNNYECVDDVTMVVLKRM